MSEALLEILKPIIEPQTDLRMNLRMQQDIRIMTDTLRELGHQDSTE